MTPEILPRSSINFNLSVRGRKDYNGIDELATLIQDVGLIEPIILDSENNLVAGGRRWFATELLGVEEFYHGVTSHPAGYYCSHGYRENPCDCGASVYEPLKCGFLRKSDSGELSSLLVEISENLGRQELSWREEIPLIVRAWRIAESKAHLNGERILMSQFGAMLGVSNSDLRDALAVYKDLQQNPDRYKECTSIKGAYCVLLKVNAVALAKLATEKELVTVPKLSLQPKPLPGVASFPSEELSPEAATAPCTPPIGLEHNQKVSIVTAPIEHPIIPLSQHFINCNSLDFMEQCEPNLFDHIYTDPDYAIDANLLSSGTGTVGGHMQSGVYQKTITQSLSDLRRFLRLAYKVVKPYGFCFFFYDVSHHEKLQRAARRAGWLVQDWPLTWRKLDYRSNASPQHNFCKNVEWCMVCRKPDAVLAKAQMTSVYDTMTKKITRELGHPFAKPLDLWKWMFAAATIKGQTIFDPFAGSGSCPIAALESGLRPVGCEVNPDHYNNLMCNLQIHYKKTLGPNIRFS